jgi:sugar lactone lactonase YvrE
MITRIGTQVDVLGESPIWSVEEQALYWVDIRAALVRRYAAGGGEIQTWPMPELVGSIALRSGGRLLLALETAIALFDPLSGKIEKIAAPEAEIPDRRFNDGKCDRQGRFWCGTMNDVTRAPEGTLYRTSGRASCRAFRSGIRIPNGLAFDAEGTTMYFADSDVRTIFVSAYDPATGTPGPERVFARTAPPAIPDGATVDAEGYLWSAEYNGGRLTRYSRDGSIARVVPVPVQKPTSCAFGGGKLDILFVTTASQGLTPADVAQQPLAGGLLAIEAGISGLPEPVFQD